MSCCVSFFLFILNLDNCKQNKMKHHETPRKEQRAVGVSALQTKDSSGKHVAFVHPQSTANEVRNAHLVTHLDSKPLNYTGPEGFQFDEDGMLLPHSILGSLEDFRSHLKATGEAELLKRIPKSFQSYASDTTARLRNGTGEREDHSAQRNIQRNALQNWKDHMKRRRQQQKVLSNLLDRPVENLLMNKGQQYREIQEQGEILNKALPLIYSGYGYRVGSEFWSLPQRFGDEMSGITATLTQTEQGKQNPIIHVGQPNSVCQELGLISAEASGHPAAWHRSEYLQQQYQELKDVLQDTRKPDISGLEVIGSGKPFIRGCPSPLPEKEHKEMKEGNIDPLGRSDDVPAESLPIPALRVCGQLARWTGNSTSEQGGEGITASVIFEAPTGDTASSFLELHNEGSKAIFYSWQKITSPQSFTHLHSQSKTPAFYCNTSSGLILPRETHQIEVIFKSNNPGVRTELWQLHTCPVLMQGVPIQIRLIGVSLYEDKTADLRLILETKLEKKVAKNLCHSIVYEVLQGVCSPERTSSPPELYITEEQEFWIKNPKFQHLLHPVEPLRRMWQKVRPGHTWDLSVNTLRQAVLSLAHEGASPDSSITEGSLAELNVLLLQLSEPSVLKHLHLTAVTIGQHLWRNLLDKMSDEAMRLGHLLGLPETVRWFDEIHESTAVAADVGGNEHKDDKNEKKRGRRMELMNRSRSNFKDEIKGQSKPTKTENPAKDGIGKSFKKKQGEESSSLINTCSENISHDQQPWPDQSLESETMHTYRRLLHRKVYALMEDLLENLCDVMDELTVEDGQDTNTSHMISEIPQDVLKLFT